MTQHQKIQQDLVAAPKIWLITGVAGFIGLNLLETLLQLNQKVGDLDSLANGYQKLIDEVQSLISSNQWQFLSFIEADIHNFAVCQKVCSAVDYVLQHVTLSLAQHLANLLLLSRLITSISQAS